MDPVKPDLWVADVVRSIAGRDRGKLFYILELDDTYLTLVNGKDRTLDKPKRKKRKHAEKVLRSETTIAEKLRSGDEVLNSELRRDLAFVSRKLQSSNLGG